MSTFPSFIHRRYKMIHIILYLFKKKLIVHFGVLSISVHRDLKAVECLDKKSFPSFKIINIISHIFYILIVLIFTFIYLTSGNYYHEG